MEIRGRRCESGQGLLEGLRDRFYSGARLSSGYGAIGVGFNARGQSET